MVSHLKTVWSRVKAHHCSCVLVGLLLRQCRSVYIKELVKGIDVVTQQGCCSLKLLMEHPAGLPVHSPPQVMGGLEGVLHGRAECLSSAQKHEMTRVCCLALHTQGHARSCPPDGEHQFAAQVINTAGTPR